MKAFLSLALVALALSPVATAQSASAPAFKLPTLDGGVATLDQYRGKVVVVNFWATWCPPCRAEIPELIRLQRAYQARGLTVLGVAMDEEGRPVVAPFVQRERFRVDGVAMSMNYRILMGDSRMGDAYAIDSLPATVVIDRTGRQVHRIDRALKPGELQMALRPLLGNNGGR
jgi:thiol-disulfide isomerase/thioredoxin